MREQHSRQIDNKIWRHESANDDKLGDVVRGD